MAITTSSLVIMPRSPWLASPGCTKNAGEPVLARVAAILRAIWPDLPIPVTTVRPRHARISSQALMNSSSSRSRSADKVEWSHAGRVLAAGSSGQIKLGIIAVEWIVATHSSRYGFKQAGGSSAVCAPRGQWYSALSDLQSVPGLFSLTMRQGTYRGNGGLIYRQMAPMTTRG